MYKTKREEADEVTHPSVMEDFQLTARRERNRNDRNIPHTPWDLSRHEIEHAQATGDVTTSR